MPVRSIAIKSGPSILSGQDDCCPLRSTRTKSGRWQRITSAPGASRLGLGWLGYRQDLACSDPLSFYTVELGNMAPGFVGGFGILDQLEVLVGDDAFVG